MRDQHGADLTVGDTVTITGRVVALLENVEYCNLVVETAVPDCDKFKTRLCLNSEQVTKGDS